MQCIFKWLFSKEMSCSNNEVIPVIDYPPSWRYKAKIFSPFSLNGLDNLSYKLLVYWLRWIPKMKVNENQDGCDFTNTFVVGSAWKHGNLYTLSLWLLWYFLIFCTGTRFKRNVMLSDMVNARKARIFFFFFFFFFFHQYTCTPLLGVKLFWFHLFCPAPPPSPS